uniref:C-type lectin domain-containing protein n=1 Tax=Fundulus heteroclitus TaxID=8078 RepID=A0A3Q2PBG6_FUNHE
MMFFFLFGLPLAAVALSDGQEMKVLRGGCPMFWYSFDGRCYKYVATLMSWADSELYCLSQGANLVSAEDDFVKSLIKNVDPNNSNGVEDYRRTGMPKKVQTACAGLNGHLVCEMRVNLAENINVNVCNMCKDK